MQVRCKLIVEAKSDKHRELVYLFENACLPVRETNGCPKKECQAILKDLLDLDIDPYEIEWLILQLIDVIYCEVTDALYIVFGCMIGEDMPPKNSNWVQFSKLAETELSEIDQKILKRFIVGV
jgi:hypothetical protein